MTEILLRPLALLDMQGIYIYSIEHFGPDRADMYVEEIEAAFRDLATGRRVGRPGPYRPDDFLVYHIESHIIVFSQSDERLEIIRVLHERMDPVTNL